MKKNIILALVAIFISVATSCTDERLSEPDVSTITNSPSYEDITYPLTSQRAFSRADAPSLDTDWENMESIVMAGNLVPLPWNNTTIGVLDQVQRKDIKKEDGWQLIAHTMNHNPFISDMPWVLIFYNQRSGELKTFYYAENMLQHNNAMWNIGFENPQGWLNGTTEVTIPSKHQYMNPQDYRLVTCSKAWDDSSSAQTGWTAYSIPGLTYDSKASTIQSIVVSCIAMTQSEIDLQTITKGTIKGSVILNGSTNPTKDFQKTLANASGNAAKDWVTKHADANRLKKLPVNSRSIGTGIIAAGAKGLVELGVNLIVGSFLGSFSQPTQQVYDVNLTTQSESESLGKITTEGLTGVTPYIMEMGESKTGLKLGTWNLKETPTVYIHPVGVLYNMPYGDRSDENEYVFCATGRYKYDIEINPDLMKHVKKYWVDVKPVFYEAKRMSDQSRFPESPINISDYGSIGSDIYASHIQTAWKADKIYEDSALTIYDNNFTGYSTYWKIWTKYGKSSGNSPVWKYIYAPANNDIRRGRDFKFWVKGNYVKVSLYIETEFEGKTETTVSTRTYIPKFEWDPTQVSNYESYNMESLQVISANDPILKKIDKNIINASLYNVTDNISSDEVVLLTKER